jgi:hypothetical protein
VPLTLRRQLTRWFTLLLLCASLGAATAASASEYRGQVTFNDAPVPGALVTATQGTKKITAVSDQRGMVDFADLPDGAWSIQVDMLCFVTLHQDVTVGPKLPPAKWELTMLPLDQIMAKATAPRAQVEPVLTARATPPPAKPGAAPKPAEAAPDLPKPEELPKPSDGLLINGSTNTAATSVFSLNQAFGNNRNSHNLYNGFVGVTLDNSALDARQYSITGLAPAKPSYNLVTGLFAFGGPINIPHFMPRGPNLNLQYEWTRNATDQIQQGLVPTDAERAGNLSGELNAAGQPIVVYNPLTGLPFTGSIPISAQAAALLALYPHANLAGSSLDNYQTVTVNNTHQDAMQMGLNKSIGHRDSLNGRFAFQSTRLNNTSLFGFVDTTDSLGFNTNVNWLHRFTPHIFQTLGFNFSRLRNEVTPNFANRTNVSGDAGIRGNLQDATDWGPPALSFSNGISGLSDQNSAFNRNRTDGVTENLYWSHRRHNVTVEGAFSRLEFNIFSQTDPRGAFTFTGAQTANGVTGGGSAFADFLLGRPDNSNIAYGNPDKYLRQSLYHAYVQDDWRIRSDLTINAGLRWEYGSPITELKNRLVNLDVGSNFAQVQPVVASDPLGPVTGQHYPTSLVRPDRTGIGPNVGIAWRPIPGSTLLVKSGYQISHDTSVYQTAAAYMDQQEPLSTSANIPNSTACAETLANGFTPCASSPVAPYTFAIDPNFRVGYVQVWNLSAQRDLPGALVGAITYTRFKGTRGVQEFYPNSYALGAANPCPTCQSGFVYRTSNGDSIRNSGSIQLRRRLRSGFTATLQYTFSKSVDDDSFLGGQGGVTGGATTQSSPNDTKAQNWLNLKAERGPSTFDQRHLLNATVQYTSGMGLGGGTLLGGWRGTALKEWTVLGTVVAGSGLPETPIYAATLPGTTCTSCIRPSLTGSPIYNSTTPGIHLNSAAFAAPASGQYGNAGVGSIVGPNQFTFNSSLARTFRLKDRYSLDLSVASTNTFNHVAFTSWNYVTTSTNFGQPASAGAMRSLVTTLRLRY